MTMMSGLRSFVLSTANRPTEGAWRRSSGSPNHHQPRVRPVSPGAFSISRPGAATSDAARCPIAVCHLDVAFSPARANAPEIARGPQSLDAANPGTPGLENTPSVLIHCGLVTPGNLLAARTNIDARPSSCAPFLPAQPTPSSQARRGASAPVRPGPPR